MLINRLTIFLVILLAMVGNVFAGNLCDLARDVTERAVSNFGDNQNDDLKLFIIAQELCPDDAANAYNLGVAYYRYGYLSEAQLSLDEAVRKDGRNVGALNNLAQVILERQGDSNEALRYAEKADELSSSPATQETLAQARFAAGQSVQAIDGLHKAMTTSSEERLKVSYDDLVNRYMAAKMEKIKAGQQR